MPAIILIGLMLLFGSTGFIDSTVESCKKDIEVIETSATNIVKDCRSGSLNIDLLSDMELSALNSISDLDYDSCYQKLQDRKERVVLKENHCIKEDKIEQLCKLITGEMKDCLK